MVSMVSMVSMEGLLRVADAVPHTTVYVTPPWGDFRWSTFSIVGIVPDAKKGRCWKHLARELSEEVSFSIGTIGTLLVVEQSSLEHRARGL